MKELAPPAYTRNLLRSELISGETPLRDVERIVELDMTDQPNRNTVQR